MIPALATAVRERAVAAATSAFAEYLILDKS